MSIEMVRSSLDAFVLDLDGVLTDGTFWYDSSGKAFKRFGPDDADAMKLLGQHLQIEVVTADARGWEISLARVSDMGFTLHKVPAPERLAWLEGRYQLERLAYMGDSFLDAEPLRRVRLGIAPSDADPSAQEAADVVTRSRGGRRAVSEACRVIADLLGIDLLRIPTT